MGWWESLGDLWSPGPVKSIAESREIMLSLSGLCPHPYHQRTRCNGKIGGLQHPNLEFKVHAAAVKSLQLCPTLCDPTDAESCPWDSLGKNTSGLPFPSPVHKSEKWKWSHSVLSNSSRPHGLQPARLLRPWDFPGKSTGVGCHCLLLKSVLHYQITLWFWSSQFLWAPVSLYVKCG